MSVKRRAAALLAHLVRERSDGGRLRPSYLVVGTKRGGSSSLAEWITRHPQVAPCRNNKGTHYFDINYRRGPAWYASRFERPAGSWKITGEASPYYMFHPLGPTRIANELPDAKIILTLRHPIDRLWSQYRYEVAGGHETQTLDRALDLEPERTRGERERLITDVHWEGYEFRHHAYLQRGHYAEQLTEVYRHFPPEQVLILQSEALFADPDAQLMRVWRFLGLDDAHLEQLNPVKANADRSAIDPASLDRLSDYYRPLNDALYSLPGVDFRWDEVGSASVPAPSGSSL